MEKFALMEDFDLLNFLDKFEILEKLPAQDMEVLISIKNEKLYKLDEIDIDNVFDLFENLHCLQKFSEEAQEIFFEEKMKVVGRA